MAGDLPLPEEPRTYEFMSPEGKTYQIRGTGSIEDAMKALGIEAPRPDYESPEFDKWVAEKHGVSPDYVAGLKWVEGPAQMLEGIPIAGAYVRNAGAAIDAGSPAHADPGASAPGETYGERYDKNLAVQREIGEAYRQSHPGRALAERLTGGVGSMGPLGMTTAGARALGITGANLWSRAAAGGASNAAIGGLDAAARGGSPTFGAALGGVLGAGIPLAGAAIRSAVAPIASNIAARLNPQAAGERQVARALMESQQTPQQIETALQEARNEGQGGVFTPADAMGNAGQRLLSTVTRAPGEGRTNAVNFLEGRQADQGRRVASQLAEGFGAHETAEQATERLTAERAAEAATNYGAARGSAGAVNVSPALQEIDNFLQPGVMRVAQPQSQIANDSIESLMQRARNMLADQRGSQVTRFDEAFRVKQELDNMIENARPAAQRVLIPVRNALDDQLSAASAPYAAARDRFREQSQAIKAVATGSRAAETGRSEDTIRAFQRMTPGQQAGFRPGYADPLIRSVQGPAAGVNKARQFTSDAFQDEARVMAPGAARMGNQLNRENTMFETRNHALGGSRTADNLADSEAAGVDPSFIGHVLSGNIPGALRAAMGSVSNGLTGNTPAVRRAVGDILLSRNLPPGEFQRILDRTIAQITEVQRQALLAKRTLAGTLATGGNQLLAPSPPTSPPSPLARAIAAPH